MDQPTDEQKSKHPQKEKLDAILAVGPGGKMYSIPLAVAEQFACDDHEKFEPEVEGRHATPLTGGYIGFHSDWLYGPYVWHQDGCAYKGLHRHPIVSNSLAVDMDG